MMCSSESLVIMEKDWNLLCFCLGSNKGAGQHCVRNWMRPASLDCQWMRFTKSLSNESAEFKFLHNLDLDWKYICAFLLHTSADVWLCMKDSNVLFLFIKGGIMCSHHENECVSWKYFYVLLPPNTTKSVMKWSHQFDNMCAANNHNTAVHTTCIYVYILFYLYLISG